MAMLRPPPRLFFALLGVFLAVISAASLADTRNREFMVFVRVLPQCRLAIPSANSPGNAQLGISCTRDTGYSVSLTRAATARNDAHIISGVGNGAGQMVALNIPAASLQDAGGTQSAASLFLTISY